MPRASVSSVRFAAGWLASFALIASSRALADETCNSPYIGNLIKGQEDYVYVWTLGIKGLGDGSDKLVTIDANPASKTYGKVVHKASVGRRGEAHHMGLTDDRRFLWAGGLDDSRIYVFDIAKDPAKPRLVKTIADLPGKTGYVGPHTFYALPGRILVQGLSNAKDGGGVTGMALYNNQGKLIATYPMPTEGGGDGYGYDIAINPQKNVALTSSFTGKTHYFDLSNPEKPVQTYEKVTGKQVNMISQSWDGERVYVASSLLANWDKTGADGEQFVRVFKWDGKELAPAFEVDFLKEKLGRAHHMKLGSKALKTAFEDGSERSPLAAR